MLGFDGLGDLLHGNLRLGSHARVVEQWQSKLQSPGLSGSAKGAENQPEVGIAARPGNQLAIALAQRGARVSIPFAGEANEAAQGQPARGFRARLSING